MSSMSFVISLAIFDTPAIRPIRMRAETFPVARPPYMKIEVIRDPMIKLPKGVLFFIELYLRSIILLNRARARVY